jgi:geranylgeranyl reductase family protein
MTARRDYDVIVVGAGPGGFATALVAARSGLRVLVLDRKRFPRDKVCGDAITTLGMTMLAQLGALEAVRAVADEQVPCIRISAADGSAPRTISTPVLVVRRRVLDATLLDLVRPLVEVREGHAVDRLLRCGDRVCGVAGKTDLGARFEATSGVVVGADGASSIVARLSGCRDARTDDLLVATRAYYRSVATTEPALEFHFLPELEGGYLWIFPLGGDRYNVGMGRVVDRIRNGQRSLRERCEDALASPAFAGRFAAAGPPCHVAGGQIPFGGTTQQIGGAGFLLVGDAAGLADAFWGDGIDTALASGALAAANAAAACKASDFSAERLASYRHSVSRVLGKKLALGLQRQRSAALDLASLQRDPNGAL